MSDIYTGRGDNGETDLWGATSRISKASHRIEAYGTVDELIAVLGRAVVDAADDVADEITTIQNTLHVVMAQLADAAGRGEKTIAQKDVDALEDRIDTYSADLPELDGFILPGGSHAGAFLHYARTVCRRAERRIVALAGEEDLGEHVLPYVNRLSDLLFVLARYQNQVDGVDQTTVNYGE